jgi:hypothetical protein
MAACTIREGPLARLVGGLQPQEGGHVSVTLSGLHGRARGIEVVIHDRIADGGQELLSQQPANTQMEPTRLTVCAIMSPTRAAHLARWADNGLNRRESCGKRQGGVEWT